MIALLVVLRYRLVYGSTLYMLLSRPLVRDIRLLQHKQTVLCGLGSERTRANVCLPYGRREKAAEQRGG
jgi:hypothetical protein